MYRLLLLICALGLIVTVSGQTLIRMEKVNGVFMIPCEVNGLSLRFVFDTGASDVSISLTEALFMLKNGYLKEDDILGTEYYRLANGDIQEGTRIKLRVIRLGGAELRDVDASVVHTARAPLLLGQSALSKLGKIQFDFRDGTLVILNGKSASGAVPVASGAHSGASALRWSG